VGRLLANPNFVEWRKKSTTLAADRALLERIINFMSAGTDTSQIIPEADLIIEVGELGKKIVGDNKSFWSREKSFAGNWLHHRLEKYTDEVKKFEDSFDELNNTFASLFVGMQNPAQRMEQSSQNEREKFRVKKNLENVTMVNIAKLKKADIQQNICATLNNLSIIANNSAKIYNSAFYVCKYFEQNEMKAPGLDKHIIQICWGDIGLRSQNVMSRMAQHFNKMNSETGILKRAAIVENKLNELKCARPSRPTAE
jgi:hypothetical protein